MKKLLLSLVLACTVVVLFGVSSASAATNYTYGDLIYTISNGEVTITDCDESVTAVDIPAEIGGYPVTKIGDSAFENCTSLESITIPDSVTTIGRYAFGYCSSLTSVTIGNRVTIIGEWAFRGCSNLKNVYISSIKAWCGITFENYGSTPATNGASLYVDGKIVTELVIPISVTEIKNYAFYGCESPTSVTIPDSVKTIGEDAFAYCSIVKVYTPSIEAWCGIDFENRYSVPTHNGANLYVDGKHVTDLVIPDSVTEIKNHAFNGCSKLTSVTIPDSVTTIGEDAFRDCSNLTSVTIPDSVTTIGKYAFTNCSNLTSVTIPDSVTAIENETFYHCSGLMSVSIGNGVTTIGYSAFSGCSSLTDVMIPGSVTTIGSSAFYNCKNLTGVTISNGVTTIGNRAFSICSMTSITIPGSVTTIKDGAFSSCIQLKSVTIERGVKTIGESAFESCRRLANVTISKSVIRIEKRAFYTTDLSTVYYDGTEEEWSEIVIKSENDPLLNARLVASDSIASGDMDGNGVVDIDDAIYLFNYTVFPDQYPLDPSQNADYNGDGAIDIDDAIYLFNYTVFPDQYPI